MTTLGREFRNVSFPQHTDRRGEVLNLRQTGWNKTKLSGVLSVRTLNTQQSCTGWELRCLGCVDRPPATSGPAGHIKQETGAGQLTASHLTRCLRGGYNQNWDFFFPFLFFSKSNALDWLAWQLPWAFWPVWSASCILVKSWKVLIPFQHSQKTWPKFPAISYLLQLFQQNLRRFLAISHLSLYWVPWGSSWWNKSN